MKFALIAYDIALLALCCLLYGGSALVCWGLIQQVQHWLPVWALILLWPLWAVVFCLSLFLGMFVLRLPVPRVPEGTFAAPGSKGFVVWTWHFSLRRLISFPPLSSLIHWSAVLRWLAYRALGMQLAFESSMSSDVIIIDPGLLSIGRKTVIGGRTLLGCHFINKYADGDKLVTQRTRIGENVNIGMDCVISPGVTIGDNCTIGTQSMISPFVTLGNNVTIKPFSTLPVKYHVPDGGVYPPPVPEPAERAAEA